MFLLRKFYTFIKCFSDHLKVSAPDHNHSGLSHCITLHGQIPASKRKIPGAPHVDAVAVSASPADCVRVGLHIFFGSSTPDLVISGVNHGNNVALNAVYSGTVGACLEGAIQGIPSIALSIELPTYSVNFLKCWFCWFFTNA